MSGGGGQCNSQAPSKTENNHHTIQMERNVAINLGQPESGTSRQGCEGILKVI